MQLKPLNEQVVVVFGASSGIGRLAALQLAGRGARVVVSARSEEGLATLVEQIRAAGGEAHALPADAADRAQVEAVAAEAVRRYGRLDTWVHAAAVSVYATFEQMTPDEFEQQITVNFLGQVHGARAALPHLRKAGGGALIHISSVEAKRPMPFHAAYAASKHALHGFLEVLRMELKHEGAPVSVTEILPPSINTPFFSKARTRLGVQPMPLPPVYPPEIVADAIVHAAAHPVREIVLGGAGKQMLMMDRMSPRLMDAILGRVGFPGQMTREPKSADAPNNLYGPIRGYDRVEGDFSKMAKLEAAAPWLERNKWAVACIALGGAAFVATRRKSSR